MKKIKILFLIGLTILTLFSVCSCDVDLTENVSKKSNTEVQNERLTIVYETSCFFIIVDNDTKVQYLVFDGFNKGDITVLVDEMGKPLLYT